MPHLSRLVLATACAVAASPSPAAVFKAGPDGDYATIQAAIDAARAVNGDHEVRVERATYVERLDISGLQAASRLVVSGGWDSSFSTRSGDASATVVDGNASGRVANLIVATGELVVEGLTLTNGRITSGLDAGVRILAYETAVVRFRDNRVVGNTSDKTISPAGHAGLGVESKGSASVYVDHNTVAENVGNAGSELYVYNVGLSASGEDDGRLEITRNTIADNQATGEVIGAQGIGVSIVLTDNAAGVFSDNLVSGNEAIVAAGVGVSAVGCAISVEDDASLEARRNTVIGNGTEQAESGTQVVVNADYGNATGVASDWLVVDALGSTTGGATLGFSEGFVATNWTIANNPGIGLRSHSTDLFLSNSIVTGNGEDAYVSDPDLDPSVLVGSDPLFVDESSGDYRLLAGSPAIDAGRTTGPTASTTDLAGNPRTVGAAIDLGAYEYQGNTPLHIPSVAHTTGFGGTPWRSAVAAVNTGATTADLELTYVTGGSPSTRTVSLPAGAAETWDDILVEEFGYTDGARTSGALSVKGAGTSVALTSRSYADGGTAGTYGQFYPALRPRDTLTAGAGAVIPLLRSDESFYTNIGMITTSAVSCTATVTLRDTDGAALGSPLVLTARAGRWVQQNKVFSGLGTVAAAYASVDIDDGCAAWLYAAVVDSVTRDPTTVPSLTPVPRKTLLRVPSVAHTKGYGGTPWRTSLAVVNTSSSWAWLTLTFRGGSSPTATTIDLGPGRAIVWDDVLVDLFGVADDAKTAGVVDVTTNDAEIVVASRTYADQGASGTYGQFYPAIAIEGTLGPGDEGVLPQLRKDDLFYTNIGLLNASTSDVTVRVTLRDGLGQKIGNTLTRTVAAGAWTQINDAFSVATAGQAATAYAVLEITSAAGRLWAYAAVVDDTTRDPTTIPLWTGFR